MERRPTWRRPRRRSWNASTRPSSTLRASTRPCGWRLRFDAVISRFSRTTTAIGTEVHVAAGGADARRHAACTRRAVKKWCKYARVDLLDLGLSRRRSPGHRRRDNLSCFMGPRCSVDDKGSSGVGGLERRKTKEKKGLLGGAARSVGPPRYTLSPMVSATLCSVVEKSRQIGISFIAVSGCVRRSPSFHLWRRRPCSQHVRRVPACLTSCARPRSLAPASQHCLCHLEL